MANAVVGLDLSLTATGIALADGVTALLSSKERGVERLDNLRSAVMRAMLSPIDRHPRFVDLAVIEGYSYSSSASHAHGLGELGGVVRLALHESGIPFAEVPPATLKKFAVGRGQAKKPEMAVAAFKAAGAEFLGDDNRCDAWWLRQIGLYHLGAADVPQTAYRDQACSVVDWPAERPEMVGSGL